MFCLPSTQCHVLLHWHLIDFFRSADQQISVLPLSNPRLCNFLLVILDCSLNYSCCRFLQENIKSKQQSNLSYVHVLTTIRVSKWKIRIKLKRSKSRLNVFFFWLWLFNPPSFAILGKNQVCNLNNKTSWFGISTWNNSLVC